MTNQNVLNFRKWLDDTQKLEQVTPDADLIAEVDHPVEAEIEPSANPQGGDLVAQGTHAFMRLHKIQKQMRSEPTRDEKVFTAVNIAASHTAVNDRPHAAYESVEEDREQIDEISGKVLGSYIQGARKDAEKKRQHLQNLQNHPSVKKFTTRRSELYASGKFSASGKSKHREAINKLYDKEKAAKQKLDPNYIKNTNYGQRHHEIKKAIDKLQYGKMTEGSK